MKKLKVPNREVLYDMYVNNNMSMANIAVEFNTSAMTVRSWLKNKKIKTKVSNITVYEELRTIDFGDNQKSLLIGSLLGDGGLRISKRGKNAYFYERHCEKQRMYLEWKRDLLMPFVQRKLNKEDGGKHIIQGTACNVQDSYKLTTIAHPFLTGLWKAFYIGNGNKVVPSNIGDYLNLFVIAVWICDDGSLVWNNIRRTYRMDIHTENFSYDENLVLCRELNKFFYGRCVIIPRKYKSGIKYYISLRGKEELYNFCSLLKVFIPDSMLYKFETNI